MSDRYEKGPSLSDSGKKNSPLSPYVALDLTDEKGFLCGKMMTDLGVQVVKVERPGGDQSRAIGPFHNDIPHPERSLNWFAFNTGKKGITLDIEKSEGKAIFFNLIKKVDFVIESSSPGYLDKIGLGYSDMSEVNPRIILTSITPFGQDGPYKSFKGPDLIVWGLGGMQYLCGDDDRPPVRISFPQSYLHAGACASAATLIAHYHRITTGVGEHVDISAQQCVEWATAEIVQIWEMNRMKAHRTGRFRVRPTTGAKLREIWPCKDGFVCFRVMGGKTGSGFMSPLIKWMKSDGMSNDYLNSRNWEELDLGSVTQEEYDLAEGPIGRFFLPKTKAELYEGATKKRIQLFPVSTSEDVVSDQQLMERNFWIELDHPELETAIKYPGGFAKFSETVCAPRTAAPLIGEHNDEIFKEWLGLSREEIVLLKRNGAI